MKFNNAFLQKNGNVGIQFDVKGITDPVTVWKDSEGNLHVSEVAPEIQAVAISRYIAMSNKFKGV